MVSVVVISQWRTTVNALRRLNQADCSLVVSALETGCLGGLISRNHPALRQRAYLGRTIAKAPEYVVQHPSPMCDLLRVVHLARPLSHKTANGPKQRLMHRAFHVPVKCKPRINAAKRRAQDTPPLVTRDILFGPEELVARAEVGAQRRRFGTERGADLVPDAGGRDADTSEARPPRPETPVVILIDEKESLVQQSDLPDDSGAEEERRTTDVVGSRRRARQLGGKATLTGRGESGFGGIPVGTSEPEPLLIVHVVNPRAEATHVGLPIGRREQLIQQHRIDCRVVVQDQDELGALIERVANTEVV